LAPADVRSAFLPPHRRISCPVPYFTSSEILVLPYFTSSGTGALKPKNGCP
jgi:hypothetical protein